MHHLKKKPKKSKKIHTPKKKKKKKNQPNMSILKRKMLVSMTILFSEMPGELLQQIGQWHQLHDKYTSVQKFPQLWSGLQIKIIPRLTFCSSAPMGCICNAPKRFGLNSPLLVLTRLLPYLKAHLHPHVTFKFWWIMPYPWCQRKSNNNNNIGCVHSHPHKIFWAFLH